MKNILRRLIDCGCTINLICADGSSSTVEMITPKGIEYSDSWLLCASSLVHCYIRQIKPFGDVSHNEIKAFIDGGKKFIDELTDDEWLVNYNIIKVN